jgi:hypothetical protein
LVTLLPHILGLKHERQQSPRNSEEFQIGSEPRETSAMTSAVGCVPITVLMQFWDLYWLALTVELVQLATMSSSAAKVARD